MRLSSLAAAITAISVVALVASPASADPAPTEDTVKAAGDTLVIAFDHDEASYVRGVLAAKVTLINLAFDDLACNKAFGRGARRTVTRKQHARLASCLLGARWRPTAATRPRIVHAGGTWRLAIDDDAEVGASTELTLRAGTDGTLLIAQIERVDWVDGEVGGVIGAVDGVVPPPPPPPPPPPLPPVPYIVAPTAIEALRIAGDKLIEPDDPTKVEIQRSGKAKVVASFKMCVGTAGTVTAVKLLKSSGFPEYDTTLAAGIKTWKYRPFMNNRKPVPVCTAVTFVYLQSDAPAPAAPAPAPVK